MNKNPLKQIFAPYAIETYRDRKVVFKTPCYFKITDLLKYKVS